MGAEFHWGHKMFQNHLFLKTVEFGKYWQIWAGDQTAFRQQTHSKIGFFLSNGIYTLLQRILWSNNKLSLTSVVFTRLLTLAGAAGADICYCKGDPSIGFRGAPGYRTWGSVSTLKPTELTKLQVTNELSWNDDNGDVKMRGKRRTLLCMSVCSFKRHLTMRGTTWQHTCLCLLSCCTTQQPLGGSLAHQFLSSGLCHKRTTLKRGRQKCALYYPGFYIFKYYVKWPCNDQPAVVPCTG